MYKVKIIQLSEKDSETRADRFCRVEAYMHDISQEDDRPLVVILPEIWATGFFNFERYKAESEMLQGETYTRLAPWAEEIGCYIIGGSIVEREGLNLYNTTLLIGPNGALCGSYRKIHLFGYQSAESNILEAGDEYFILKTKYGLWGFSTCYDLRFPELYREMSAGGVDTVFVVAAWPKARQEHWMLFNRTRALENLCYLVSCNCAGELKGHALAGNSMVVDPWGEVTACAGEDEELLSAVIDPQKTDAVRAEFPALQDRRIIK